MENGPKWIGPPSMRRWTSRMTGMTYEMYNATTANEVMALNAVVEAMLIKPKRRLKIMVWMTARRGTAYFGLTFTDVSEQRAA